MFRISATFLLPSIQELMCVVYYSEHQPKNKKRGRPGNEASKLCTVDASANLLACRVLNFKRYFSPAV